MLISKQQIYEHSKHLKDYHEALPFVRGTALFLDVETTDKMPEFKTAKSFDKLPEEEKAAFIKAKDEELDKQLNLFRIVQFCGIIVENGEVVHVVDQLINPEVPIPVEVSKIHNIYDNDVVGMPTFQEFVPTLRELIQACDYCVAFNANFDKCALEKSIAWFLQDKQGIKDEDKCWDPKTEYVLKPFLDPYIWAIRSREVAKISNYKMGNSQSNVAKNYAVARGAELNSGVGEGHLHNAYHDTLLLTEILEKMIQRGDIPWSVAECIKDQDILSRRYLSRFIR